MTIKNRSPYFLPGFGLVLLIIAADQYTKWMVIEDMLRIGGPATGFRDWLGMNPEQPLNYAFDAFQTHIVTPFLNLVMVWNPGISFGLFGTGTKIMSLILIGISLLASTAFLIWMACTPRKIVALALALVTGGAIGNVIDRIRFGAVADFIDVHAGGWHWPAFNLADSCITIGAALMIIDSLILDKEKT